MMHKLFCIFLVFIVCSCVYLHGTGFRFSVERYLSNIDEGFREMPDLIGELIDIWIDDNGDYQFTEVLDDWLGSLSGGESSDSERKNFFEKVIDFFVNLRNVVVKKLFALVGEMVSFVRHCFATVRLLLECGRTALHNAQLFYPWNSVVWEGYA